MYLLVKTLSRFVEADVPVMSNSQKLQVHETIFNDVKELDYPLFKGLNSTTIDMIGKVNPATEAKRDGNS